jgi:tetratricopeptide (TPR) repeat protein
VTPPLTLDGMGAWNLDVAEGATRVAVGARARSLAVLELADLTDAAGPAGRPSSQELCDWAELVSGARLDSGGLARLTREEWLKRWKTHRAPSPEDGAFSASPEAAPAWHRLRMREALAQSDGVAAVFHAQRLTGPTAAARTDSAARARAAALGADWALAAAHVADAIRQRPDDTVLRLDRGDALVALGRWSEAEEEYRKAMQSAAGRERPRSWARGGWWVIGSYPKSRETPFAPERAWAQTSASPPPPGNWSDSDDPAKPPLRWRLTPQKGAWLHPAYHLDETPPPRTAYALTFLYSAKEQALAMSIGCDDVGRLWLNGQQIYDDPYAEWSGLRDPMQKNVTVRAGWNTLFAKVHDLGTRPYAIFVHISDDPSELNRISAMDLVTKAGESVGHGRHREAAGAIAEALRLDPGDDLLWQQSAILLAHLGDEAAYRQHCAQMLQRFKDTNSLNVAERVAKTCCLLPGSLPDMSPVAELMRRVTAGPEVNEPWVMLAMGMVEHRRSQPEDALRWLGKARGMSRKDNFAAAAAHLCEAAVLGKLGRREEAARALETGRKMAARLEPSAGPAWDDWLLCELARREAEQAIAASQGN